MKHIKNIKLLFFCASALLATGCSNEDAPNPSIDPSTDPDAIELGIIAGVALTKSAVSKPADLTAGIAVYACLNGSAAAGMEDPYTAAKKNYYAVYGTSDGGTTWAAGTEDRIRLTSQKVNIYAYYPAITPAAGGVFQATGNALKVTGTISDDATVGISVFPGGASEDTNNKIAIPSGNNADSYYSTGWTTNTDDNKKIIYSAPGEVDYMYADNSSQLTASNGKASGGTADDYKVELNMKHALSMVSFRIYNDGTYQNTGKLTKIVLQNVDRNNVLSAGTDPKMNIKTGAITPGTADDSHKATYTRFIDGGYTLIKNTGTDAATTTTSNDKASAAAKKFSILVLPDQSTVNAFDKTKVQVVFTIDGADYPVTLSAPSSDSGKWLAGKNYLYTAKLSGKELSISSVTVSEWTAATGGNLEVN